MLLSILSPRGTETSTHAKRIAVRAALLTGAGSIGLFSAAVGADDVGTVEQTIVVIGKDLQTPPGMPAYGETLIERDRLQSVASGRLEDALRDVAGFSQFRRSDSRSANPSAQGANLRSLGGNAASRTLVLLDGVPLADPFFGYIPYSSISPDRLSYVDVVRGGGAGAFGAGAVAGTINMTSASREELGLFAGSALYGSRDSEEYTASLTPTVGDGFVSVSGRYETSDGIKTTPRTQRVAASAPAGYTSWSTALRAVAPINETMELQSRIAVYRDRRTLRFTGADSTSDGQDASLRFISRGAWQIDALAYVQARNFSNIVISSTSFRKTLDQRDTPALGLGGKVEMRPPVGTNQVLRIGIDARKASGDMLEDVYNASLASNPITARRHAFGQQFDLGGFLEDNLTLGHLVVTAGARVDHWTISNAYLKSYTPVGLLSMQTSYADRSGWEAGGRAGAVWRIASPVALRAAAYTGFRLPTLNELYRSFTVFPVTTTANPELIPERLRGVEAGIDMTPVKNVKVGLTVFDNRLGNAIANVTTGVNLRKRMNVHAIEAQGVEFTANAAVGPFALTAAYTYSYSKIRAAGTTLDGLDPAQSPRNAASATLGWTSQEGVHVATTLRYIGRQFEDDLNADILPHATTIDGYLRIPVKSGFALIGRAENVLDAKVYTRRVSTPTLSEDIGSPRTLWIGVAAAF